MTAPDPAAELVRRAERLAAEGEREGAAWAWYRAASLAADHDPAAAAELLDEAATVAQGREAPRLIGSIALLHSELAFDGGDAEAGAAASVTAERAFQAAGDARGFLAVWVARALRALRGGDREAGLTMTRWMLGWLDEVAEPAPRLWLRLYAAEHLRGTGRAVEAVEWLTGALDLAPPGSAEFLTVIESLAAAFLSLDRPADAARVAVVAVDTPGDAPASLRARAYRGLAAALRTAAPGPLVEYCELAARALDQAAGEPDEAPPSPGPRAVISPLLL